MSDYISREAAIRVIDELYVKRPLDSDRFVLTGVGARLEELPAADVRPVRRGKWVPANEQSNGGTVYCFSCCSECGRKTATNTNFCPNCGADMREEIDHD